MGNAKNVLKIFTVAIQNLPTIPYLATGPVHRGNTYSRVFVIKVGGTNKFQTFIFIKQIIVCGFVLDSYSSVSKQKKLNCNFLYLQSRPPARFVPGNKNPSILFFLFLFSFRPERVLTVPPAGATIPAWVSVWRNGGCTCVTTPVWTIVSSVMASVGKESKVNNGHASQIPR